MTRRELLAAAGAATASAALARFSWAQDLPRDVRVTRVVCFELNLRRPKYVGKNARRDDHGEGSTDRILRIYTNAGIDGIGPFTTGANEAVQLLGKNPFDFWQRDQYRMVSPIQRNTTPLWDLAGKFLRKPIYELLGGRASGPVPVYDGAIYMSDLLPQYANNWEDQFKRELDISLKAGHRAFKIKVGRGNIWMPQAEGDRRDVEVLRVIRRHVGPDALLMVDANDGYSLERTKRLLAALPDFNFTFVEEMFPDNVEQYLDLKAFIKENGWKTLIADGENLRNPDGYARWLEGKAVDVLQGDMNQFGFEDVMRGARMGQPNGAVVAPHNWGSLFGYYAQLHAGLAIPNWFRAEQDPLSSPAVIAEGYRIIDGASTVPDTPGLGIRFDDEKLPDHMKVHFDLKA